MILDKNLKNFLSKNYYWNGNVLIEKDELEQIFEKANYYPSSKLLDFLTYFYGCIFKFGKDNKVSDVDFRIKKVLKDYPHKYYYLQIKRLLKVESVTPFGEIENGHMVLISDESDNIYGVYDDYVIKFGHDYYAILEMFYRNED